MSAYTRPRIPIDIFNNLPFKWNLIPTELVDGSVGFRYQTRDSNTAAFIYLLTKWLFPKLLKANCRQTFKALPEFNIVISSTGELHQSPQWFRDLLFYSDVPSLPEIPIHLTIGGFLLAGVLSAIL